MGKILQIIFPNIKFLFILAIIVKGIKHARNKSAHAKLAKYLLVFNSYWSFFPKHHHKCSCISKKCKNKYNQ